MNPLNYIQRAMLINEFTASELLQFKIRPCNVISMAFVLATACTVDLAKQHGEAVTINIP